LLFPAQIAGARLRASQHDLAITCLYARSDAVSVLVIGVGVSLQTVVKMFTDVLRTSACCVSCWRGDQQSGQYGHAKHKLGRQGSQKSGKATRRNNMGLNNAGRGPVHARQHGRDHRVPVGRVRDRMVHRSAAPAPPRTARRRVTRWPKARTPKRRDVPIAPRAPQQKKARRSCGRKHTSAPAFIIKLLIRTRRGVFRDV
jgi:hypothetical protein